MVKCSGLGVEVRGTQCVVALYAEAAQYVGSRLTYFSGFTLHYNRTRELVG